MAKSDILNSEQAADLLGLTPQSGRLDCFKLGRDWIIPRASVEEFQATRRPPGRPRKSKPDENK